MRPFCGLAYMNFEVGENMRVEIKKIEVFTWSELSEDAQDKAVQDELEYRWNADLDECGLEFARGMCLEVARALGFCSSTEMYFGSIGCGGSFAKLEGSYSYTAGSLPAIMAEYPQWASLHDAVRELQALQQRHFYGLSYQRASYRRTWKDHWSSDYTHELFDETSEAMEGCIEQIEHALLEALESQLAWYYSEDTIKEDLAETDTEYLANGERY
jgi:hypothetical protein